MTATDSTGLMVPAPPFVAPDATVVALTTGTALTVAAHAGKNITNTGASTNTHTLPAVAVAAGVAMRFQSTAAQVVRLDPSGSEQIFLGGSGVAGKYVNIAAAIGNYAEIYCDGRYWHVIAYSGVVTKEG
jgi:hypothetical protein